MFFSALGVVFWMTLAAVPGALLGGPLGALAATCLALLVYVLMLLWKLERLDHWLSSPQTANGQNEPAWRGVWREMALRVQRMLRQQEKLAQAHEKRLQDFLLAIQASPNGVILLDEQSRIEWCNDTAATHLGLNPKKDHLQHIVHLLRDPAFARYFAQDSHASDVIIDARSSSVMLTRKLSLQLHAYGEGLQLLLTRDITAMAQADAMRRDFVANVSHEIRTPLTVLSGFIETLQTLSLSPQETRHYLQLMALQSDRMQSLVADLLMLSQLEGSQPPGVQEQVPLRALMAQVQADAQPLSDLLAAKDEGSAHTLIWGPMPELSLLGSRSELFSAVSNLVNNAIRYTPTGGRIEITWKAAPEGLVFTVKDSGPGIGAEHLPRLSERFYRVDRSRSRETGGTGLGLAITKHVMQRHGGELRIESALGKGSSFMLVLPSSRVLMPSPEAQLA